MLPPHAFNLFPSPGPVTTSPHLTDSLLPRLTDQYPHPPLAIDSGDKHDKTVASDSPDRVLESLAVSGCGGWLFIEPDHSPYCFYPPLIDVMAAGKIDGESDTLKLPSRGFVT